MNSWELHQGLTVAGCHSHGVCWMFGKIFRKAASLCGGFQLLTNVTVISGNFLQMRIVHVLPWPFPWDYKLLKERFLLAFALLICFRHFAQEWTYLTKGHICQKVVQLRLVNILCAQILTCGHVAGLHRKVLLVTSLRHLGCWPLGHSHEGESLCRPFSCLFLSSTPNGT